MLLERLAFIRRVDRDGQLISVDQLPPDRPKNPWASSKSKVAKYVVRPCYGMLKHRKTAVAFVLALPLAQVLLRHLHLKRSGGAAFDCNHPVSDLRKRMPPLIGQCSSGTARRAK